ncbi:hypothetical protein ACTFIW_010797 [Dictyostelium discoideum]
MTSVDINNNNNNNNNSNIIESKLIGHKDTVLCISSHNKKEIIASGSDDCTVRIWDLNTNKSIQSIVDGFQGNPVNNVCFDQDFTLYCSYDNIIVSFDLRQPNVILKEFNTQYKFNTEEINQLSFDSKYQYLAACDDSGQTKIIDVTKNKLVESLNKKHTNIATGCVFRPNSKNELITSSMDFSIIHWDFLKAKVLHRDTFKEGSLPQNISKSQQQQQQQQQETTEPNRMLNPPFVTSVDCSNNSKYVAISMGDGTIVINEISSFKQYLKINSVHKSSIQQVHYPKYLENNYQRLISFGNYDKKIVVWDVSEDMNTKVSSSLLSNDEKNNERIKTWLEHSEKINCLTTSNLKNNAIFVADLSNDLKLLSIQ